MDLTIHERLLLLNALPKEGDLTTIRIVRELREALSPTEEEHKKHSITVAEDGSVSWKNDAPAAIELGAKAREIAVKALEALDKAGSVTEAHLSLFDKFGIGLD